MRVWALPCTHLSWDPSPPFASCLTWKGLNTISIIKDQSHNGKCFQQRQQCILTIWTVYTCFFHSVHWCLLSAYERGRVKMLISRVAQWVKSPRARQEMQHSCVWSQVGKIPLGKAWQPLQYSCLENLMARGAWWAIVHTDEKSQTQLSEWAHTHRILMSQKVSSFIHRNRRKTRRIQALTERVMECHLLVCLSALMVIVKIFSDLICEIVVCLKYLWFIIIDYSFCCFIYFLFFGYATKHIESHLSDQGLNPGSQVLVAQSCLTLCNSIDCIFGEDIFY